MTIVGYPPPQLGALPVGALIDWPGAAPVPALFLAADASSVLRASYPALFAALSPSKGTVTITIAAPAVLTRVAHGLKIGDRVFLETTGALPTGLATDATANYYVFSVPTADTFTLGTGYSINGATHVLTPAGQITTTGSQSGVHTLFHSPYGCADATHFTLPNPDIAYGQSPNGSGLGAVLGAQYGQNTHQLLAAESGLPDHVHNPSAGAFICVYNGVNQDHIFQNTAGATWGTNYATTGGVNGGAQAAASAHNNVPLVTPVKKLIYAGV